MPVLNPWALLAFALALLGAGAGGFRLGVDHVKAQQLESLDKALKDKDAAEADSRQISQGFQLVIEHQNTVQRSLEKRWRDALNKPVYRDCHPDADGLRVLRDEFAAGNAARGFAGALPAAPENPQENGHGGPGTDATRPGAGLRDLFSPPRRLDRISPEAGGEMSLRQAAAGPLGKSSLALSTPRPQ